MNFSSGKQPSVLKHDFSMIPKIDIPRSSFNRSFGLKTAFDSAKLIPIFADLMVPGDTANVKTNSFVRLSTPLLPFMDNLRVSIFYFSVPIRQVWTNFKKFMGEQVVPGDSTTYTLPVFSAYAPAAESLSDYLGIPISGSGTPMGAGGTIVHHSLFHRAYSWIFQEWFRDENLFTTAVVNGTGDGPDTITDYVIRKRGKRFDYFTSCLPWAQKSSSVSIGLTGNAAVGGIALATGTALTNAATGYKDSLGGAPPAGTNWGYVNINTLMVQGTNTGTVPAIYADLSTASATTINALRLAWQLQIMYERDARGGTRYREIIQSHFGISDPNDTRLQRPEYLGGGTFPIVIQPVAQTSATSGANALGRLAAVGTASNGGCGFVKSFTEHCIVLGIACVTADLTYQAGLERMFSISTRADMYWPAFSQIGEQAVLNKEIYCQGSANLTQDAATFGFQERYAEMRYKISNITGKMRSQYSTPLDAYHLAQKFISLPTLGETFITEAPPVDRVVAVNTEPQFFGDFYFDYIHARPMPTYGIPSAMSRF